MRCGVNVSKGSRAFLEIKDPNFVDICEVYLFKSDIFVILEYVGLSIEHLLQKSILKFQVLEKWF